MNVRLPGHSCMSAGAEISRHTDSCWTLPQHQNKPSLNTYPPIHSITNLEAAYETCWYSCHAKYSRIGSFSEASVKLVCHVGSGDKRDALVNVSRSWSPSRLRESECRMVSKWFQFEKHLVPEQDRESLSQWKLPFCFQTSACFGQICVPWTLGAHGWFLLPTEQH